MRERAPRRLVALALLVSAMGAACARTPAEPSASLDLEAWERWRAARAEELSAEDGWLSLIGLYWLTPGAPSTFGVSPDNRIVLPERPSLAGLPATLGTLALDDGNVTLTPSAPGLLSIDGEEQPVSAPVTLYRAGVDGAPGAEAKALRIGTIELMVIERAGEVGLRARDRASERRALLESKPIPTFPPSTEYRVEARLEPAPEGSTMRIVNVVGQVYDQDHPGSLVFELEGRTLRLEALDSGTEGRYFLIVGDETNGAETYGGGRYLYVAQRPDGAVDLDLNRLYNPPCVFTEYATCPLPPRANRLPIRIEAGEKLWQGDLVH